MWGELYQVHAHFKSILILMSASFGTYAHIRKNSICKCVLMCNYYESIYYLSVNYIYFVTTSAYVSLLNA